MDRFQRIAKLWDWLPAFRAIAETENMHRAAERLGTSPSALSRTLGLLEKEMGEALFQRIGRSLHLTELGNELPVATRDAMRCDAMRCDAMRCDAMRCDAMRGVDDVVSLASEGPMAGTLKISSAGRLTIV